MKREEVFPETDLMSFSDIKILYQTIKPIIRDKCSYPYFLRQLSDIELINSSYTWLNEPNDYYKEVNFYQLSFLSDIKVLMPYDDHPRLFKPTVGEIISQIPENFRKNTVAFEIIVCPMVEKDIYLYSKEFESGFHVCTVRLYQLRND